MCVCACVCTLFCMCADTRVSQKRVSDSPELEFQRIMRELTWVLETEHRSSVRRANTLNHWATSPASWVSQFLRILQYFLLLCIDYFILLTHPSTEEQKVGRWIPDSCNVFTKPVTVRHCVKREELPHWKLLLPAPRDSQFPEWAVSFDLCINTAVSVARGDGNRAFRVLSSVLFQKDYFKLTSVSWKALHTRMLFPICKQNSG